MSLAIAEIRVSTVSMDKDMFLDTKDVTVEQEEEKGHKS
jgi:hypothetical protein